MKNDRQAAVGLRFKDGILIYGMPYNGTAPTLLLAILIDQHSGREAWLTLEAAGELLRDFGFEHPLRVSGLPSGLRTRVLSTGETVVNGDNLVRTLHELSCRDVAEYICSASADQVVSLTYALIWAEHFARERQLPGHEINVFLEQFRHNCESSLKPCPKSGRRLIAKHLLEDCLRRALDETSPAEPSEPEAVI